MPRLTGSRLVLAVQDLASSSRYWMDTLGCRRDFGEGTDGWSFLSRDDFSVMLGECSDSPPASELGDHSYVVYVHVEEIDALHSELVGRGALIMFPPADKAWGMREFGVRTPDGHRIMFGQPIH